MSKKLPLATTGQGFDEAMTDVFSGLDRSEGITEGAVFDTCNMTGDFYPAIGTRPKRAAGAQFPGRCYGAGYSKKLYYCAESSDGKAYFYYDNEKKFEVTATEKAFVSVNSYICVFPDKKYFSELQFEAKNFDAPAASLEELHNKVTEGSVFEGGDVYIAGDGVYSYNPSGVWDTLTASKDELPFAHQAQTEWIYISDIYGSLETDKSFGTRDDGMLVMSASVSDGGDDTVKDYNNGSELHTVKIGDAVTLTIGFYSKGSKNYIYKKYDTVLTKAKSVGTYYDYTFAGLSVPEKIDENGEEYVLGAYKRYTARITKKVPDFTFVFNHKNRLWGAEEGKIYSSALGDPTQFTAYNTSASGAWAWESGDAGEFTGGCSFSGYPTFFKEDRIIKIGGDYPAEYATYETASVAGIKGGCGASAAVSGANLYYVSPEGIMRYSGSFPVRIGAALGQDENTISSAVGGAADGKYYLSSKGTTYVYNTLRGFWMIEDKDVDFEFFFKKDCDLFGTVGKKALKLNCGKGEEEKGDEEVSSYVEFAPFFASTLNKKGLLRINVNLEVEGTVKIFLAYDTEDFKKVWEQSTVQRKSFYVPINLRRAEMYRIKIESEGRMKLYALSRTFYRGSRI